MAAMKQVLFVDDETKILDGLKRLLRPMRDRWEMHFEPCAARALERIATGHFDVVVSDMRMPAYTGVDVLRQTKKHCPDAVRIGLSGYADSQLALEAAQVTHQFLAKPCDAEKLVASVDSVVRLQERLGDQRLISSIGGLTSLPSLPNLYLRVTEEAASPTGSLESVGEIIASDVAMTAKILQLVNSAYFGLRSDVTSPVQATRVLGLDAVRAIVITVELFSGARADAAVPDMQALWQHSIVAGGVAKQAARALGLGRKAIDQALLAGMLHDVGKLVEISGIQEGYARVKALMSEQGLGVVEAERQVLGCTHADIGAYLLTLWGFTSPVVEAVAYHHHPGDSLDTAVTPLTAVHLAEVLTHGMEGSDIALDVAYLERVGVCADEDRWRAELQVN